MINFKQFLIEAERGGDCFDVSSRLMFDLIFNSEESRDEWTLVHAGVLHSIENFYFLHGWAEHQGQVYDYSNGRHIIMPVPVYYGLAKLKKKSGWYKKYTFDEFKKKINKSGHFGPWDKFDKDIVQPT